jgi:outer membrane protein
MIQLVLTAVFGFVVFACPPVFAETVSGLKCDLMSVLRVTLANQMEIEIGELDVESARGDVQAAGGRFDSTMYGRAFYEKNDSPLTDYERNLFGYYADKSESADLEVGLRKMFRNGLEGEAAIESIRVNDQSGLAGYPAINRNRLKFSLTIPLSRGGTLAVTAEERQNEFSRKAAEQRYQRTLSDAVATTVTAYWDYLEAYQNAEIKRKIEERTAAFLKNTNRLVELGERPSADSKLISAQLASKRGERIEAERGLYEEKQGLGIAMGISLAQVEALGDPLDVFPNLVESECSRLTVVEGFLAQALKNRGDYQAARLDEEAVGVNLEKSMDGLKPRLDLTLSANIQGVNEDSSFLDPTVDDSSGPGGMILLNGDWPISNNRARGEVVSIRAQQRQARLRTLELERNIRSNIAVAAMDVRRIAYAAISINEAVELYNTAVSNEVSMLKRGFSTLVNTISVEDRRNNAQEDLIVQQSALAKAIVRLRNETGSLLRMDGESGVLDIENLVTLPQFESKEEHMEEAKSGG